MATATVTKRGFIALVNEAYPECVEKPIVSTEQTVLMFRVLRALESDPSLADDKTVRHNLNRFKRDWIKTLRDSVQS